VPTLDDDCDDCDSGCDCDFTGEFAADGAVSAVSYAAALAPPAPIIPCSHVFAGACIDGAGEGREGAGEGGEEGRASCRRGERGAE